MDDRDCKKPSRDRQIEVMTNVSERTLTSARGWIARPEIKAILRRQAEEMRRGLRPQAKFG